MELNKSWFDVFLAVWGILHILKCLLFPYPAVPIAIQGLATCWSNSMKYHVVASPPLGNSPSKSKLIWELFFCCWSCLKELPPSSEWSLLCLPDVCSAASHLTEPSPDTAHLSGLLRFVSFAFPPSLPSVPVLSALGRDLLQSAPKAPRDLSDSGAHVCSQSLLSWVLWITQSTASVAVCSSGSGRFLSWKVGWLRHSLEVERWNLLRCFSAWLIHLCSCSLSVFLRLSGVCNGWFSFPPIYSKPERWTCPPLEPVGFPPLQWKQLKRAKHTIL